MRRQISTLFTYITRRLRSLKHPKLALTALVIAVAGITALGTFAAPQKKYTYDFSYVQQGVNGSASNNVTLADGENATFFLDLKNTGTETWHNNGANPLRLATARPFDRVSPFLTPSWIATNRPATFSHRVAGAGLEKTDRIAPGEIARFTFPVRGNAPQGKYREYVQPVVDGKFRINRDLGIHWEITAKGPGENHCSKPGSVIVHVFIDSNRNGKRDPGEQALPRASVTVGLTDGNAPPSAPRETDQSGDLTIHNLFPGEYFAAKNPPDGSVVSPPRAQVDGCRPPVVFNIAAPGDDGGTTNCSKPGSVIVHVFQDKNHNKNRDPEEVPFPYAKVIVGLTDGNAPPSPYRVADKDGNLTVDNLFPGEYFTAPFDLQRTTVSPRVAWVDGCRPPVEFTIGVVEGNSDPAQRNTPSGVDGGTTN